jgi:hypothetical protein
MNTGPKILQMRRVVLIHGRTLLLFTALPFVSPPGPSLRFFESVILVRFRAKVQVVLTVTFCGERKEGRKEEERRKVRVAQDQVTLR